MGTEACSPNSAQKYATGRLASCGYDVANHVPPGVASCAVAAATASYRLRNTASAAHAASRAGSTRRSSSMGLCWVRRHSAASSSRNRARALRFQLHDRLAAMAPSWLIRSGTAEPLGSGGVIALQAKCGRVGVGSRWTPYARARSPLAWMTTGATMTDAQSPRPLVRRHHWLVRITHWVTVVVLAGMITSGLQIYEAYARFGNRGGPYFPSPLDGAQFPQSTRLGGWLAGALNWHFWTVWVFVAFTITHVVLVFVVDPPSLRAMITGWYRGRFPSHD